jgi:hypothetical protein
MLTARAEAVIATGMCDDGPFAAFENAVLSAPPEIATRSKPFVIEDGDGSSPLLESAGTSETLSADITESVKGTVSVDSAGKSTVRITDAESPAFDLEKEEAERLERKRKRDETQPPPKKKPIRKVAVGVKKVTKKPAPKVVKKGKK